jgi:hypothetical protein
VTTTAPVSPESGGPAVAQALHDEGVHVHVQAVVHGALAGDQAHLLAAIAVGDPAVEGLLDDLALEVVQDHGRGDDALGPDPVQPVLPEEVGEQIQGVGMAEEQRGLLEPDPVVEAEHGLVVHAQGVQVGEALQQEVAHIAAPGLLVFRVAPDGPHGSPSFQPAQWSCRRAQPRFHCMLSSST